MRTRSQRRIDALQDQVDDARQERDHLRRRLDSVYAAIRVAGQQASAQALDEHEVAVVKIAAAVAALPGPGWVPVPITVRGQKVIVLVCNCETVDPEGIYQSARQLTRPLRSVKTAI